MLGYCSDDGKLIYAGRVVVKAIAFGLRFEAGRRVWQADEYMAVITAKRLIEHLTLDGFVVLKLPPIGGHSALGQEFEG